MSKSFLPALALPRPSFEVKRERPSPNKAQRFVDLLRQAEIGRPLSEDRLIELQNAVVDPRYREASYRTRQNWIGDEFGYVKRVEFVPPRPEDVRGLMDGLTEFDEEIRYLMGFDRARSSLNAIADWPDHSLDLFINVVRQNDGKLSANKRKSHFPLLRDEEIERFERIVAESFDRVDDGADENTSPA